MTKPIEYCYSTDEENFQHESFGDMLDYVDYADPLGLIYFKGEKVELTHTECIDVDSFLEMCDEQAYEEIGEIYDNCFTAITASEKDELKALITWWTRKHVNLRYWKVINVQELTITSEDLQ
jgi:hypothetical protein